MANTIEKEKRKKIRTGIYKKLLYAVLPAALVTYLRASTLLRTYPRLGFSGLVDGFFSLPLSAFLNLRLSDFVMFALIVFAVWLLWWDHQTEREMRKHDNPDTVNGEAHLMTLEELQDYQKNMCDPIGKPEYDGKNNMILSKDIRLAIDGFRTRRNCNVLTIGGSGAGKSRFFAAPNILQFNTNFVITDPSGELRNDYAKALENAGYEILTLDITDVYRSNRYNPFHYIKEEKDVFILVNTLIKNTTPPKSSSGDPIWENGEKLILEALILYLWHTADESEQTFENVVKMINMAEIDENDATAQSPLDVLFAKLAEQDPENLAVEQYKTFKIAAGKTMKSFLISVGTRMEKFKLSDICYLTGTDDFHFENFADGKKALFIIIPTADTTFNFIVSMLYSQLFTTLYYYVETRAEYGYCAKLGQHNIVKVIQAESRKDSKRAKKEITAFRNEVRAGLKKEWNDQKKYFEIRTEKTNQLVAWRGTAEAADRLMEKLPDMKIEKCARRCPYHVRFILDEFANIGQIPNFSEKLATIRKYEISCAIIIQALSQLKKLYEDDWNSITANCDTKLFLGCDDTETIEWLLKMLGKKTTTVEQTSYQGNGNGSTSYNKSSLEILTIDQISMMQDDECLVRIRGKRPYYGKKYELTEHPNYAYAHSLSGEYEIPLSDEAREKRDRNRGPLRLRKPDKSVQEAIISTEGSRSKVAEKNENRKEAPQISSGKDAGWKERNAKRLQKAENEREDREAAQKETVPPPELTDAMAEELCSSFGIKPGAPEEEIKEAVESLLVLEQPSFDVITYGMTE